MVLRKSFIKKTELPITKNQVDNENDNDDVWFREYKKLFIRKSTCSNCTGKIKEAEHAVISEGRYIGHFCSHKCVLEFENGIDEKRR